MFSRVGPESTQVFTPVDLAEKAAKTQGPRNITSDVYFRWPYLQFRIQLNHIKYLIGAKKALTNTIFYIFEELNWASVAYLRFINHHYIFWGMDSDFQRSIHKWIFGRKTVCQLSYIHSFLKYIFSHFAYGSLVKPNIPLLLQRRLCQWYWQGFAPF